MSTVTVIGGGFGGVYTAKALLRLGISVRLISRDDFFTFTPLLHEVATGTLRREDVAFPYASFFAGQAIEIVRGSVSAVDDTRHTIELEDGRVFEYDIAVLATGSVTDPGAIRRVEGALTLKSVDDALAIRAALEKAGAREQFRIGVVGAGPTGIELICEIRQLLRSRSHCSAKLDLFSGRTVPFENQHPRLGGYIRGALERLRISLHEHSIVDSIENGVIHGQKEDYPADLIILTTGVRPATEYVESRFKDGYGNIRVEDTLRLRGSATLYALGDAIILAHGKPPALAQLAVRQARLVADNIARQLRGKPLEPYKLVMAGILVSLGKWDAVGTIFGSFMSGRLAWYIWRTVYLFKTPGVRNKLRIAWRWTQYLFDPRRYFRIRPK